MTYSCTEEKRHGSCHVIRIATSCCITNFIEKNGGGRVAAQNYAGTPAIRNLIRENKICANVNPAIQTGGAMGMQTL